MGDTGPSLWKVALVYGGYFAGVLALLGFLIYMAVRAFS